MSAKCVDTHCNHFRHIESASINLGRFAIRWLQQSLRICNHRAANLWIRVEIKYLWSSPWHPGYSFSPHCSFRFPAQCTQHDMWFCKMSSNDYLSASTFSCVQNTSRSGALELTVRVVFRKHPSEHKITQGTMEQFRRNMIYHQWCIAHSLWRTTQKWTVHLKLPRICEISAS